jgi:hypothetical protein
MEVHEVITAELPEWYVKGQIRHPCRNCNNLYVLISITVTTNVYKNIQQRCKFSSLVVDPIEHVLTISTLYSKTSIIQDKGDEK